MGELGVWTDGGCSVCVESTGETRLVAIGRGALPDLSGGALPELSGGALPELTSGAGFEDCGGVLLDGSGVLPDCTSAWVDADGTWARAAAGVLLDRTGA